MGLSSIYGHTVDSNYGTLYGGMVERRVGNISLEDQDISLAVEVRESLLPCVLYRAVTITAYIGYPAGH